jgi:hypothetical protein
MSTRSVWCWTRWSVRFWIAVLIVGGCLSPLAASAAEISVDCDNNESLQAAIDSLDKAGPNTINVTGTCYEWVWIGDGLGVGYQGLVIQGPEDGLATITPPSGGEYRGYAMVISGGHSIFISRLALRGAQIGLYLGDQSEVDTNELTIEDNASIGVNVAANSVLWLAGATIKNNGVVGIEVYPGGTVFINPGGLSNSPTPAVIEGHSVYGVNVELEGRAVVSGLVQVRNNGTAGEGQSAGIHIARNSALHLAKSWGSIPEISGNQGPGIRVEVSSSILAEGATIANNTGAGIRVERLSIAEVYPANSFSGNGTSAISCDLNSWAVGNLTGVAPLDCKNLESKPAKDKTAAASAASAVEFQRLKRWR